MPFVKAIASTFNNGSARLGPVGLCRQDCDTRFGFGALKILIVGGFGGDPDAINALFAHRGGDRA